jgi:hypothetical protein
VLKDGQNCPHVGGTNEDGLIAMPRGGGTDPFFALAAGNGLRLSRIFFRIFLLFATLGTAAQVSMLTVVAPGPLFTIVPDGRVAREYWR